MVVRYAEGARFERFAHPLTGTSAPEAYGGAFRAHVTRADPSEGAEPRWHTHELAFRMVHVLHGWARLEYEAAGAVDLRRGDGVYQRPGVRHREIVHSDDLGLL